MLRVSRSAVRVPSFVGGSAPLFDLVGDKGLWQPPPLLPQQPQQPQQQQIAQGDVLLSRFSVHAFHMLLRHTPAAVAARPNYYGATALGIMIARRRRLLEERGLAPVGSEGVKQNMPERATELADMHSELDQCLRLLVLMLQRANQLPHPLSAEMQSLFGELHYLHRRPALLISHRGGIEAPRNIFSVLYNKCTDAWREVLSFI